VCIALAEDMKLYPQMWPSLITLLLLEAPIALADYINPTGNPPALLEDLRSMTIPEIGAKEVGFCNLVEIDGFV